MADTRLVGIVNWDRRLSRLATRKRKCLLRYTLQGTLLLLLCSLLTSPLTAQNQTLINHQRARNLNREGYRAYQARNWNTALRKFAEASQLDPYYTYPLYNSACVLSLRGWPADSLRIYRLLMEVLLQESGGHSVHQIKMRTDADLAWFRRHEAELFTALNNVMLDYSSENIYHTLASKGTWNLSMEGTDPYAGGVPEFQGSNRGNNPRDNNPNGLLDFGGPAPDSLPRSTPPDPSPLPRSPSPFSNTPQNPDPSLQEDDLFGSDAPVFPGGAGSPAFPFGSSRSSGSSGSSESPESPRSSRERDPSSSPSQNQADPGSSFFPFIPQSLRKEYEGSQLALRLVAQQARLPESLSLEGEGDLRENQIRFEGRRYRWRFTVGRNTFEMSGFFVVRGNVLILETFASSPEELHGLPFDWQAFRSLYFVYQPQANQFYAITTTGEHLRID